MSATRTDESGAPPLASDASPFPRAQALGLALAAAVVYAATSFGGLRSPDGEIVFRTAESLAERGSFAVSSDLELVPGFGLATGLDGGRYSVFGPLHSLVYVPLLMGVRAAAGMSDEAWRGVPWGVSFYVGKGYESFMLRLRPSHPRAHGERFVLSFLNAAVTGATVWLFAGLAARVSGSRPAALGAALLFAFGSLAFPYAASDFSEPLATLLALGALGLLVRLDPPFRLPATGSASAAAAGLLLGLSTAAHVTGVLFLPPFAAYAWKGAGSRREGLRRAAAFALGFGAVAALLAAYNLARFGAPWETGRGVDAAAAARYGYGSWAAPFGSLVALLFGPAKGLFLYCPAVLLGLLSWRALHRRSAALACTLAAAAALRLLFVAARSDWHGGRCVGPRYLVPLLPFLLLSVAPWLAEAPGRWRAAGLATAACAAEQLYFVVGEPMSYYLVARAATGRPDGAIAPLLHLLDGPLGPFWLHRAAVSPYLVFLAAVALAAPLLLLAFRRLAASRGVRTA